MNQLIQQLHAKYKNLKHLLTSIVETIKAGYPAKNLTVIGVTGTDGKTTTAHLIYEILKNTGKKAALVSTIAAYIGDKEIDTGLHTTTPDATVLQPLLAKFVQQGVKYVVLEVTSHGLDQHRVFGCNFWAGVLTNITHEHLDYHKTFENYRATKAKLFRNVKLAVLNKDDDSFEYFKQKVGNAKVVTYGLKDNPYIKAVNIQTATNGTSFTIDVKGEKQDFETKLFAEYNVSNILAAASLTHALNIPWTTIRKTVSVFNQIPGRMEFIQREPFSVVVDFAHTPNGLKNALGLLRHLVGKKGKVITVFGSAGERDRKKREMMGEISGKIADISIFTAEDPRSEDVHNILEQIARGALKAGGKEGKDFFKIPERGEAIAFAIQKVAKEGDIVGIFGKGHEKSLAYEKFEHPWNDQEFVKSVLQLNEQKAAIVLAAGKGSRMQSETPKVLHKIAGRPMIAYPLENLRRALFGEIVVVVGYKKDEVINEVLGAIEITIQPQPLGNAHAVSFGLKRLSKDIKNVMIVQGDDSAFYTPATLANVFEKHTKAGTKITLATIFKKDPGKLGIVKRDQKGNILGIEHWSGEGESPGAGEINCGLWVFEKSWLEKTLPKIKKNEKGEYYLTEVIGFAADEGVKIQTVKIPEGEWVGVNTPEELATANQKMAEKLQGI